MSERTSARRLERVGWTLLAAAALALAFPFRAGDVRFDLGWLAGALAVAPFVPLARGLGARAALTWGTLAGTLGYTGVLFWIYVVVVEHGHGPGWLGVLSVVALALYIGLHLGLATGVAAALEPRAGAAAPLVLPAAWVVGEWTRTGDVFSGFPWAFLGYSAHATPPLRALASLGGVYALTFLLALFGVLVARRRLRAAAGLAALALAAGLLVDRGERAREVEPDAPRTVAIVQASIPQDEKWQSERRDEAFARHLELSRAALQDGRVDLVIWPETAVPVFLELEAQYREPVAALARETGATLLVGGLAAEIDPGSHGRRYRFYNSVFVVGPDGRLLDRYDKAHLVPFGEYVPLRALLGPLFALAGGLAQQDATAGPGPRAIALEALGPAYALAPLICYEVIYPSLVRAAVRDGARVLLNVTNDAWYGRSSAPHQFLAIAAMRSAETGRPMLRAANTGVSAVIHAGGAVESETPIFEARTLRVRIPFASPEPTLYVRLGDYVVWASLGLLLAIGGKGVVGRGGGRLAGGARGAARASVAGRGAPEAPLTSKPSASASPS